MKKISLSSKKFTPPALRKPMESDPEITSMMLDPRYLRQSSSLIQDALQKGFDVLQLANGDIVTTGTKTVVFQYTWDKEKGKLVKAKQKAASRARQDTVEGEEPEFDSELESEPQSESEDETN